MIMRKYDYEKILQSLLYKKVYYLLYYFNQNKVSINYCLVLIIVFK